MSLTLSPEVSVWESEIMMEVGRTHLSEMSEQGTAWGRRKCPLLRGVSYSMCYYVVKTRYPCNREVCFIQRVLFRGSTEFKKTSLTIGPLLSGPNKSSIIPLSTVIVLTSMIYGARLKRRMPGQFVPSAAHDILTTECLGVGITSDICPMLLHLL